MHQGHNTEARHIGRSPAISHHQDEVHRPLTAWNAVARLLFSAESVWVCDSADVGVGAAPGAGRASLGVFRRCNDLATIGTMGRAGAADRALALAGYMVREAESMGATPWPAASCLRRPSL
jgi:hypothetical protein